MNQLNDIHDNPHLKCNPFKAPEGYLESLEENLLSLAGIGQDRAAQTDVTPSRAERVFGLFKPALLLACTFGVILGMGYGVLRLTNTINKNPDQDNSYFATMIESGLLRLDFIDSVEEDLDYFDDAEEIDFDEDTIVSYLASQYSSMELAQLYYDNK